MRVALCGAFFVKADILLLDEPTNHLDFPSLLWLEAQMRSYPKSLVVVCHDREILNNIATGVIQITDEKQLKYWRMGFEQYEKERWKAEKRMAKSVDKFLARNLRVDPSSESYLEVKRKREWMDKYNKMMVLRAGQFTFPPPTEIAPDNHQLGMDLPLDEVSVIKVDNVTFSYDAETLPFIFKSPISIDIKMSTRMGVQGPNGAGKSTFLKLLTGRLQPVTGTITTNKNATVGYFSQHHSAEMDLNTTPMDFMTKEFPDEAKARCRQHLGKVGVLGDLADSRMISLSQGMRSCVLFAKITMRCPSLLIMDEPTNFLDLETVDALIGAANKFQGALLLVSHSRLFSKNVPHITCLSFLVNSMSTIASRSVKEPLTPLLLLSRMVIKFVLVKAILRLLLVRILWKMWMPNGRKRKSSPPREISCPNHLSYPPSTMCSSTQFCLWMLIYSSKISNSKSP